MAFSFLNEKNLSKHWRDSEKRMKPLWDAIPEYERIARNRPHPKIDKAYPRVTDGTLASIIQETPKRVIQQVPTGSVSTNKGDWLDIFADWKLREQIIPNANCQADFLQKSWRVVSGGMTCGSCPYYIFMDNDTALDYLGANGKVPYIGHVYFQKGKVTAQDCNFQFLEAWYQESDIDYLIEQEKSRKKEEGKDYQPEWDIAALENVKKQRRTKAEEQKTPKERETHENIEDDGIRIVHAFQRGIGATFYSFVPDSPEEDPEGSPLVIRRKANKDPRGVIPLEWFYFNIDFSNPLGRGVVELSGGMQNLLDSHTQAFQYMQALEMNPPIVTKGDVPRGAVKYVPNKVIHLNDQNASIEPLKVSTQAVANFPTTYGLIKSQILNLNNSNDTSVSAEVGNPGFSKTDAGVNALQQRLGVSDNYVRKQYESWFERVCETKLNLTFAETSGVIEEHLDSKTADKLRNALPEGNEVIYWSNEDDDTIYVDYDQLGQEPIKFAVDASTSRVDDDKAELEALTAARELILEMLPPSKQMSFANKLIDRLGLEDPEDIKFSKDEIDQTMQMEQMQATGAVDPAMAGVPPEAAMMPPQAESPLSPEEEQFAQGLVERGLPTELVQQAIVLIREGYSIDQVAQVLMESQGAAA